MPGMWELEVMEPCWSSSGQMSHIKTGIKWDFMGWILKSDLDPFSLGKQQHQIPVRAPGMGVSSTRGVPKTGPCDNGEGIPLPWEQRRMLSLVQSCWLGYPKWAFQGAEDQSSPDRSQVQQQQPHRQAHTRTLEL